MSEQPQYQEPEILKPVFKTRAAYLLIAPAFIVFALFIFAPIAWMILTSFTEYNPITETAKETGFIHYRTLLTSPPMWRAILNMTYFSLIYIPVTMAVSWLLASLFRNRVAGSSILKGIFCAPYIIPAVAVALIWRSALMPVTGTLDKVLSLYGIIHPADWSGWLGEAYFAMPSLAIMCAWRDAGFLTLIMLAAMSRVPRESYELALLDGADRWQTFKSVTYPACRQALLLSFVLLVVNTQNLFQEIFVMTEDGGPANWTVNIPFLIYRNSFVNYAWGQAAAISTIFFVMSLVIIYVLDRTMSRRFNEGAG